MQAVMFVLAFRLPALWEQAVSHMVPENLSSDRIAELAFCRQG